MSFLLLRLLWFSLSDTHTHTLSIYHRSHSYSLSLSPFPFFLHSLTFSLLLFPLFFLMPTHTLSPSLYLSPSLSITYPGFPPLFTPSILILIHLSFSPCSHSHPLRSLLSIISLALSFSISFLLLPLFLCSYSRILLVISATLVSSLCRISPSFLSSLYISISPLSLPSVCPSLLLSLKMKGRDANEEVVLI